MGMFDYVIITCPNCDKIVEDQTKSFNCLLDTINLDTSQPSHIASHFIGIWECDHCNKPFKVDGNIPDKILLDKRSLTIAEKEKLKEAKAKAK